MKRALLLCMILLGCSGNDFKGGIQPAHTNTPTPTPTFTPAPTYSANPTPTIPTTPTKTNDSTELYQDCTQCLARAKQLSPTQGFTASMENAYSLGKYKVSLFSNTCDIHFLATPTTPIVDHDGRDSMGPGQVILYCPCNCGWKSYSSFM